MVDEEAGPTTKKEYEVSMVPVGQALTGISTDFLGRQKSETQQQGSDQELPLFNEQPPMDDREQIQEPLFTGLKVNGLSYKVLLMHVVQDSLFMTGVRHACLTQCCRLLDFGLFAHLRQHEKQKKSRAMQSKPGNPTVLLGFGAGR